MKKYLIEIFAGLCVLFWTTVAWMEKGPMLAMGIFVVGLVCAGVFVAIVTVWRNDFPKK